METPVRIAITMGDPAGIGPEVIVKAAGQEDFHLHHHPVVVGDAAFLRRAAARFAPHVTVRAVASVDAGRFEPGVLNVLDRIEIPADLLPGRTSAEGGRAAVASIRKSLDLALHQKVEAITTAPINKESVHRAGFPYAGHTEMLADFTGVPDVALMLAGERLRVVLVTTHVPLQAVQSLVRSERVFTVLRLTDQWLARYVREKPRIAVTGLNPHCGDGGIFGQEERDEILPALERARQQGMAVEGPFSADALFARAHSRDYDAVVAMYHDQGMIPIKMDSPGAAVNITLGLPILRTSVDHGTAFDIAGRGVASPESLLAALRAAARLAKPACAPQ